MKTFRFLLLMMLCLALLPACGDDDEDVAETYKEWKEENEKFFDELVYNVEYTKLTSQSAMGNIYYKVIEEGTGPKPFYNDSIRIYYKGSFIDSTPFDSVMPPYKKPYPTRANGFIDGFTTALINMKEGAKWNIWIPQELAYGSSGSYNSTTGVYSILPFSVLNFDIELVEVIE